VKGKKTFGLNDKGYIVKDAIKGLNLKFVCYNDYIWDMNTMWKGVSVHTIHLAWSIGGRCFIWYVQFKDNNQVKTSNMQTLNSCNKINAI
jgi:hypothetical protein